MDQQQQQQEPVDISSSSTTTTPTRIVEANEVVEHHHHHATTTTTTTIKHSQQQQQQLQRRRRRRGYSSIAVAVASSGDDDDDDDRIVVPSQQQQQKQCHQDDNGNDDRTLQRQQPQRRLPQHEEEREEEVDDEDETLVRELHQSGGRRIWNIATVLLLALCMVYYSASIAALHSSSSMSATSTTERRRMIPLYEGHCSIGGASESSSSSSYWTHIFEMETSILTNLIHAALLAATALVVYLRGDVVWLYFLYYTMYYWTLVGSLYTLSYVYTLATSKTITVSTVSICHLTVTIVFTTCSAVLLYHYRTTSQYIICSKKRLNPQEDGNVAEDEHDDVQVVGTIHKKKKNLEDSPQPSPTTLTMSPTSNVTTTTTTISSCQTILRYGITTLQVTVLIYFILTTISWWFQQEEAESNSCNESSMSAETTMTAHSNDNNNDRFLHDVMTLPDMGTTTTNATTMTTAMTAAGSNGMMMSMSSTMMSMNGDMIGIEAFVMAYSETAHASFVWALIQLAATYPHRYSCVVPGLVAVGWRLLIATASLLHICFWRSAQHTTSSILSSTRDVYSMAFTVVEVLTMIPIVSSLVWMAMLHMRRQRNVNRYHPIVVMSRTMTLEEDEDIDEVAESSLSNAKHEKGIGSVLHCENQLEDIEAARGGLKHVPVFADEKDGIMRATVVNNNIVATFRCVTVSQIASNTSQQYSSEQRYGAMWLSYGCTALVVTMGCETILHLSQTMVGSDATHDIYKWGMHTCIMYSFVTTMSVETPYIYQRARLLLALACPTGSILALYQLYQLIVANNNNTTIDVGGTICVALLLVMRALSGMAQSIGLILLKDTTPTTTLHHDGTITTSPTAMTHDAAQHAADDDDHQHYHNDTALQRPQQQWAVNDAQRRAVLALYWVYIPTVIVYTATSALSGNCLAPMISPMLPPFDEQNNNQDSIMGTSSSSCGSNMMMDLMLMQNIPGLGLFFHFGLVAVFFAYDGIQVTVPTYRPSLCMASIIMIHVGLLSFASLLWDIIQTQFWSALTTDDIVRRVTLLLWSLASLYFGHCLHRLWKVRRRVDK